MPWSGALPPCLPIADDVNLPTAPTLRRPLRLLGLAVLAWQAVAALAQAQSSLTLREAPRLLEAVGETAQREGAVHLSGQSMTVIQDDTIELLGQAQYRRPGLSVKADRLLYQQATDTVQAQGQVRIVRDSGVFYGPSLKLQVERFVGEFEQAQFELANASVVGDAAKVSFLDADRAVIRNARFSSCRRTPGPEWLPEWLIKAATIEIDNSESVGRASDTQLVFKGLATPTIPSFSFALNDQRKSGFLAPLFGIDDKSGLELSTPYYWNIAPNRDATFTPVLRSRRGLGMDTEFRYLEPDYQGAARLNVLPNDRLRDETRWGLLAQHQGNVPGPLGTMAMNLQLARVSDHNYWRDFPRSGLVMAQRLLPSWAMLDWSRDDWSASLVTRKWQTLQIEEAPITPPFDVLPQLTVRHQRQAASGLDTSVIASASRFEVDPSRLPVGNTTALYNGLRHHLQAQASWPLLRPWGFVTPKLQLHATRYQPDHALAGNPNLDRTLPTFSVDSGLFFERPLQWGGRDIVQTLEPRLFYAYTPYRAQDNLPVYDSGPADFNLSTIYSTQPYVGQDRLVDNNAVTLGLFSRLIDDRQGAELLSLGVAQRYRFTDQRVALPGQPLSSAGLSDLLLGAGLRLDDRWRLDNTLQLNAQDHSVQRTTLRARYNPGPYRVLSTAYRQSKLTATPSEQIDLGWQWPLSDLRFGAKPDDSRVRAGGSGLGADRWYSMGRLNYSLQDRRLVDTLIGFEYDAGCWVGRVVFERLSSTSTTSNNRLLFQLELVDFARVGSNPLKTLRDNIPRYQLLREDTPPDSRFLHYE